MPKQMALDAITQHHIFVSLLETKLPFRQIAKRVGIHDKTVGRYALKILGETLHSERVRKTDTKLKRGAESPHWKGGTWLSVHGYVLTKCPEWYTKPTANGQVRLHLVNYCLAHGLTEPPLGFEIHHIDRNRQNNHPDNLIPITSEAHRFLHSILDKE